jgi:hypothetical protein
VRLSLGGGKQPDHQEVELERLAEFPLKELRARLKLKCESSRDSGGSPADPAGK